MTREEQIRLLANIRYDELTTKDTLTRIVSALPVSDPAPVGEECDGWQPHGGWCSTRGWPWEVKSEPIPVPPKPLTEEDVRRIVREEIASAMQGKESK